jgi:hypothetical protein
MEFIQMSLKLKSGLLALSVTFTLNGIAFATNTDVDCSAKAVVAASNPVFEEYEQYLQTLVQPSEDQLRLQQVLAHYEQNRPDEARALFGDIQGLDPETPEPYVNDTIRYQATIDLLGIYNQQQVKLFEAPLKDIRRIESLTIQMKDLCARYLAANVYFLNVENPKPGDELSRLSHNITVIRNYSDFIDWLKQYVPTGDYLADTLSLIESTERGVACLRKLTETNELKQKLDPEFAYATFSLNTRAAELYAIRGQMVEQDNHMAIAKAIAKTQTDPAFGLLFDAANHRLSQIALFQNMNNPDNRANPHAMSDNIVGAEILDERRLKLLARFDETYSGDK